MSSPSSSAGRVPAASLSPLALAVLLVGGFVTALDVFIVNVALPSLQTDLAADFSEVGLVVSVYALSFGTFLIAGSSLGDRHGRRRTFVLGLSCFSIASLVCGLAPSAPALVAARMVQGASGAILFPQIYSVLRVMYDAEGRRRAFAYLGATLGFAAIAGQILGGAIVWADLFGLGWRVAFFLNLPVGAAAVLLSRAIPESRAAETARLDWVGIALSGCGALLLLLSLLGGSGAAMPRWAPESATGAVALLAGFAVWERHLAATRRAPAIDPAIFANPGFPGALGIVLLIYATPVSFFLCFALTLQTGYGLPPLVAAGELTPMSLGFIAASLAAPKLAARIGSRAILAGMTIYAVGFLWCVARPMDFAAPSLPLFAAMAVFGFGQGLSGTPLLNFAIGFVAPRHAGMAAGLISTMQQIGGAFGAAVVGLVFAARVSPSGGAAGYAAAFSLAMRYNLAAILIAALLLAALSRGRPGVRTG